MAQAGHRHASAERRTLVNYRDMGKWVDNSSVSTTQCPPIHSIDYSAISRVYVSPRLASIVPIIPPEINLVAVDTVPSPVSLSEALRRREGKEKELLAEGPSTGGSGSLHAPATTSSTATGYAASKGKGKSRFTNGKERLNGSISASSSRKDSKRDPKGRWSNGGETNGELSDTPRIEIISTGRPRRESRAPRRDLSPSTSSFSARPSKSTKNGVSSSPGEHGHSSAMDHYSGFAPGPPPPFPNGPLHDEGAPRYYHSSYISTPEEWPGAYTGPASGFLAGTFNHVPSNPGRTIYSQRYDPSERSSQPEEIPPPIQHYRPDNRTPHR